jgi:phytoene dehydrogenase-like protein
MFKSLKTISCKTKNFKAGLLSSKLDGIFSNYRFNNSLTSHPDNLKSKYDIIIVGAGHNGLVAANYLAKFSKKRLKICILENREVIGGAAVTQELIPGYKFSRASYLLSLFRPVILEDLGLMRHGILKFYKRNPSSYTPLLENDRQFTNTRRSLTLSSDLNFNCEQIEKFSKKDAQNYGLYEHWLAEICSLLEKFIDMPPPSRKLLSKKNLLSKINYLNSYLSDMKTFKYLSTNYEDIYRLFTEPAANLLDEWFESDW